ncbi:MAG: hypothetical protein EOO60_12345, partial [Hymenobacter sp.]
MKTIFPKALLLLLLNLLALGICQAQDVVDYVQVGLMKADYDHRAVLYLGNSKKAAAAVLGTPSSQGTYYSEMDDVTLDVWTYGNSKLYFDSHGLSAYDIVDPTIAVGSGYATSFRVGSSLGGSPSSFYGLAVNTTPGTSRNLPYDAIALAGLKSGDTFLSNGVEVLFNASGTIFN